jgi:undecaprenyl-diphosphatase
MSERLTGHEKTYRQRIAAACAFALVFCVLAFLVKTGKTQGADSAVVSFVLSHRTPALNAFFSHITYAGNWQAIVSVEALLVIIPKTRKYMSLQVISASLTSLCFYKILKLSFARPRPDSAYWLIQEHGFSFPSGHSMNGMLCYGIIIFMLIRCFGDKKPVRVLCWFLAALVAIIGISRIYVSVHYISDVAGGWSMGAAEICLFSVVIDAVDEKIFSRGKKESPAPENAGPASEDRSGLTGKNGK